MREIIPDHPGLDGRADIVLEVDGLRVTFGDGPTAKAAIDDFSFSIKRGETLGIIGESGCGKSLTALAILGLTGLIGARTEARVLKLLGEDLPQASPARLRQIRGGHIGMIFQEPMTSLNPVLRVGDQIAEAIVAHEGGGWRQARQRAVDLLDLVRLPEPHRALSQYPHEMSGGMRQRVMIAMALACRPSLIIADEPTTALDVTVQRQVLDLIAEIGCEQTLSVLLITHNLGVIAEYCDRVIVMYAGRKAEECAVDMLFENARHPYSAGLLRAIPGSGSFARGRLQEIPGAVPALSAMPSGCRFAERCPSTTSACAVQPPLLRAQSDHVFACWHPGSPWRP